MDLDQIQRHLTQFLVCGVQSRPGAAVLALLVAVMASVWVTTLMFQRLIMAAVAVVRVLLSAVAGLSAVVTVGAVFVVFALLR